MMELEAQRLGIAEMESPRPTKRRRRSDHSDLITPPPKEFRLDTDSVIERATHVLATEAAALANISTLYRTHQDAQKSLRRAVNATIQAHKSGGKLIACGVGKSAYIATKLVATCKSLGIGASFMHACEAVHGDLGDVRPEDVLLFVTYSGRTAELLNVVAHVPETIQMMAITSHLQAADCALLAGRTRSIVLPAPIPEKEESSFGVSAPTTSTTVALAVADMLALTVADELHRTQTREVFQRNHPGGAIGIDYSAVKKRKAEDEECVVLELPSPSISGSDDR